MKFWCFLLIACVIQSLPGSYAQLKSKVTVALVTYKFSGIPKCSGTFVTSDTILTSATCLFCDQDCDLMVEVSNPEGSNVMHFDIKEILIHEKYELQPSEFDIGLIKINESVSSDFILPIRDLQPNPASFPTYYHSLKFKDGSVSIQSIKTTVITNAKCSHILHSYIPSDSVCIYSAKEFHFQEQSQGLPLVYEYGNVVYLTGIYVPEKQNYAGGSRVAIFEKIGPVVPWIVRHTRNVLHSSCSSSNEVSTTELPTSTKTNSKLPVIPFDVHHPLSDSAPVKSSSKYAPSSYAPPPQTYSQKVPPPQTYSQKVPPPQTYSQKVPPPQTYSQKVPPPQTYSQKVPPPQTYSQKVPPPQTYSQKVPPPQTYSQKVPPPQTYSQKVPPHQTYPQKAIPSKTYSQKVPPPQTYSQKVPPHQTYPQKAIPSKTYSQKVPPPQTYSQRVPPPQTYSQRVPPHQTYSQKVPPPQTYSQKVPPHQTYPQKAIPSQTYSEHASPSKTPPQELFPEHTLPPVYVHPESSYTVL